MKKTDVMEALLDANSNVPASVISFVGANLKDNDKDNSIVFNHDADNVFDACGIVEKDTKVFAKAVNDYMESLPEGSRARSKAIEFVFNSGNPKWMLLCVISAMKAMSENETSDFEDLLRQIMMLKRKGRQNDGE